MTAAQPSERLWTSDNDEYDGDEVSEVHNRMPESFTEEVKVPEVLITRQKCIPIV